MKNGASFLRIGKGRRLVLKILVYLFLFSYFAKS